MNLKQNESQTIEFKPTWRYEYYKWICAFANTDGGKLLIGVDDNGKPVGIKVSKKLIEELPNKFRDIQGIIPNIKLEKEKEKDILIVEVQRSYAPISYHGRFYVRSGSTIRFERIYRKEELEYPEEALREAIINAVIHRDYIGPHTQLKIYPDKIILRNVETLPKENKIEELKKNHASCPRNEIQADVFFKAGLIETWDRGKIKIIDESKKSGLPEPDFKEEFGGFAVSFYKDIYTEENLRKMGLNERQILERIKKGLMEDLLTGKVRVNELIKEKEIEYEKN